MKLGRNDPCHCGSGRKYKKCCSKADEEARSAELAAKVITAPEAEADEAAAPPGATPNASNKGAPKAAAGPKPNKPPRQKTTQLRRRSM